MRLYFIRHGQSENNLLWEETGSSRGRSEDPELTRAGHQQAQHLADFLRQKNLETAAARNEIDFKRDDFRFTHFYTSLMVRSVATGSYVAKAIGLPLSAWSEIHECGGIYEEGEGEGLHKGLPGKTRAYFAENYADLVIPETLTIDDGWWNRPFEAREERPKRAKKVLDVLLDRHGGTEDRVAIVSHGGFYMEFVRVLFNIGRDQSWFLMNNTGISRFDFHPDGEVTLVYHNRTDHLPEKLIT